MKQFREDANVCRISSGGTDPVCGRTPIPARLSDAPDSLFWTTETILANTNMRTVLMATGLTI